MRSESEVNHAIELYSDMIMRICMVNLKNHSDSEDIFQNVFLKYATSSQVFESEEHEKAWFIRVTMNACKDLLRNFFRSHTVTIDDVMASTIGIKDESREVINAVLSLPSKYRDVVYLHYYEGYTASEIGSILNINVNTIYTLLNRAKVLLRELLGGEEDE